MSQRTIKILGFDIGGANTKSVLVQEDGNSIVVVGQESRYFPLWQKSKEDLPGLLVDIGNELRYTKGYPVCASITAELSDAYATKREGVLHVVSSLKLAFPGAAVSIFTTDGTFKTASEIEDNPLPAAAANWVATAQWVAERHPDCILIDIGSTTVDIIPILGRKVAAQGRTDLQRLLSHELVYTGVLRATIPSISHAVPYRGKRCPVSFEKFATMADVHLVLNNISEDQYTSETADGRAATLENTYARLARIVCADFEEVTRKDVDRFARFLHKKQVHVIANAINEVCLRFPSHLPFVLTGLGADILGTPACKKVAPDRQRILLAAELGKDLDPISSAYAVAWCYWQAKNRSD